MFLYGLLQSLVFSYLSKVLFLGFLQFKGNFIHGRNNSKFCDIAPLTGPQGGVGGSKKGFWKKPLSSTIPEGNFGICGHGFTDSVPGLSLWT